MSELSGRSGIAPPLPEHPTRARMRKSRGRLAHIDRRAHITRRSLEPAFSAVLSVSLTAPSRSSSAMTSGLPVAAPRTASQGGDGALPVPVQEAYVNARVLDDAGWYGCSRYRIRPCCLLLPRRHRHPGLHCFRRSQPGLRTPLSTLRVTPHGATCMTRGRCGSLPLHRSGLSPPTSCRSPGAPRLNGWPIRSPTDASPTSSRTPAHGSGATWIATPSSQWTFTAYSLPVSRRTHSRCGLHTRAVTVIRDPLPEGFRHFVASMPAPVASGWSGCRVGLAPTGKRRLVTAHTQSRHGISGREGFHANRSGHHQ
jgi:hypothetical protein